MQPRQVPETVVGKELWRQLKSVVKAANYNDKLLNAFAIPENYVVAPALKALVEKVTAPPAR